MAEGESKSLITEFTAKIVEHGFQSNLAALRLDQASEASD